MRLLLRLTLGIALFAVALVAFAPATLIDPMIARLTDQRIRLSDAFGFWWRGHGTLVFEDETRVPIAWRVSPARVFERALVVDLFDSQGTRLAELRVTGADLVVNDVHATLPASLLATLDRSLAPMVLGGTLTLDVRQFAIRDAEPTASGHATWDRARIVAGNAVLNLGIVSLVARPSDTGLSATIKNDGGDVALTGTLLTRNDRNDLALDVRPTSATPDSVRTMLPMLGAADDAGNVHVKWSGKR